MVAAKHFEPADILAFDWDTGNLHKNRLKHQVTPKECEEIFYNRPVSFYDEKHSLIEERYVAYGKTDYARPLTVVFTIRNNKIRVISARDQNRAERIAYKERRR
jgi:uncharacterized protein